MSRGDGYRSHGCGGRCWAPGIRGEGGRDQHHERGRPDLGGLCSTDWRFPGRYHQGGPACGGVPPPLALLGAYRTPGPGRDPHRPTRSGGEHGRADRPMDGRKGRQRPLVKQGASYRDSPSILLSGLRDPLPLTLAPNGSVLIGDWGTGIIYQVARRALARPGRSRVVLRVTWRELRESRSPSRELSRSRVRRPCSDSYSSCHLGQSSDAAPSWWNCRSSTSTSTSTRRLRSRHRHPPTRRSRRTSRGVASVALHLLCFDCIKPSPRKM